jgi:hypothetical protein
MTNSLQRNNKFVTVRNKCSKNPTVSLNKLLRNSCADIACCSSELIVTFLYACSSLQNARQQFGNSSGVSTSLLYTSPLDPPKQKSKGVWSGECSSCTSLTFIIKPTCSHQPFSHNDVCYLPNQLPRT